MLSRLRCFRDRKDGPLVAGEARVSILQEWAGADSSEDKFTLIGTADAAFVLRHEGVPAHRVRDPEMKKGKQLEAYARSYAKAIRPRLEMRIDWDLDDSQIEVFCSAFREELLDK